MASFTAPRWRSVRCAFPRKDDSNTGPVCAQHPVSLELP